MIFLLYLLLLLFIILLLLCFFTFEKEIINPVIVFCSVYVLSITCAVLNIKKWGIIFRGDTFLILFLGALEFILISFFIQRHFIKSVKNKKTNNNGNYDDYIVPDNKINLIVKLFIIYDLTVIIMLLFSVYKIAIKYESINNISKMLRVFRDYTAYNTVDSLPKYITLLMKPLCAGAYVFSFIYFKYLFFNNNDKNKIIKYSYYLIPAFLWIVSCYIRSYREGIIIIALNLFTMCFLLWYIKNEWKKTIKISNIIKIFGVLVLGLILFYYSATLVGRKNDKNMFEYITFYVGGSIECLNRYMEEPLPIQVVAGEETFYNLIVNFDSIKLTNYNLRKTVTGSLEFRYYKGIVVGNVYTAYRRWLHDFGIIGIVILQAILAIIINVLYSIIKYRGIKCCFGDYILLIYSFVSYVVFMHPIGDYFYFELISRSMVLSLSLIVLLYYCIKRIYKTNTINSSKTKNTNRNKRILVFGMTENPGGVESVIMNYYRELNKRNIQFDFLCNTKDVAYESEILSLGGKIHRITARSKNRFKYLSDMKHFFEENADNYSTIWVNVCSLANIDYLKYAKKYGIKYRIIHSHNSQNMDSKLRMLLHIINKRVIDKYATDFWSCSDEAAKWFYNDKIIKSENYLYVNNAIDASKYKYNKKIRNQYRKKLNIDNKLVFGNIGRFHFQKNHPFIIKTFAEILKEKPNSVLLLIGKGDDEETIKTMVKKYNISDKVLFLGIRNDVEKIMQAMDVLIFPSLFEGLPLVLVEAQAADLLIFASDVITKKVKFSNRLKFISLDENEKVWSKKIINSIDEIENRSSSIEIIINNGFDIETESKKIEKIFKRN